MKHVWMCVVQDFEAFLPEFVGENHRDCRRLVVLLLKTVVSLKQLYTMTMVCLAVLVVDSGTLPNVLILVVARFNKRFIPTPRFISRLSSTRRRSSDELNVLPISHGKTSWKFTRERERRIYRNWNQGLEGFSIRHKVRWGSVKLAKRNDQAQAAVLTFIEAIAEKTLSSTVTLTASRGRVLTVKSDVLPFDTLFLLWGPFSCISFSGGMRLTNSVYPLTFQ